MRPRVDSLHCAPAHAQQTPNGPPGQAAKTASCHGLALCGILRPPSPAGTGQPAKGATPPANFSVPRRTAPGVRHSEGPASAPECQPTQRGVIPLAAGSPGHRLNRPRQRQRVLGSAKPTPPSQLNRVAGPFPIWLPADPIRYPGTPPDCRWAIALRIPFRTLGPHPCRPSPGFGP